MDPHEQSDCSGGDLQLDLELNRFLEADFELYQLNNDHLTGTDPLSDELLFTDISNSIDIPDLDFGDNHHISADFEITPSTTTATEVCRSSETQSATKAETAQSTSSLRVVIPASALSLQPFNDLRLKSQAAKPTWSSIWSKRQKAVKEELLSLHQQVVKLESRLEQLRQNAHAPSELERILKHEIDKKQKAEAENAKLKRMLERELETTRRLSKLLRKCQDVSVDSLDL